MAWIIDAPHQVIGGGATARWWIRWGTPGDMGPQFISVHPKNIGRLTMLEFSKEALPWLEGDTGFAVQGYRYWVLIRNDSNHSVSFYFEGY